MKKKAKYTSIARSIVRNAPDKRPWKGIELAGELEETGNFIDSEENEDTVVMDFEDLTHVRIPSPPPQKKIVREVNEYTIDGEYLNTYSSSTEAAKTTGVPLNSIRNCCSGVIKICKKSSRIFLYREDDIEERMAILDAHMIEKNNKGLSKVVDEYSLNGRILMVYESQKQAAKVNHYSSVMIGKCCRGEVPFLGKSVFLYHGDSFKDRLPAIREQQRLDKLKRKRERPIDIYSLKGEYLAGYPSESEAYRATGISIAEINRCCREKRLYVKDKIFLYTGSSISERIELINSLKEE